MKKILWIKWMIIKMLKIYKINIPENLFENNYKFDLANSDSLTKSIN